MECRLFSGGLQLIPSTKDKWSIHFKLDPCPLLPKFELQFRLGPRDLTILKDAGPKYTAQHLEDRVRVAFLAINDRDDQSQYPRTPHVYQGPRLGWNSEH